MRSNRILQRQSHLDQQRKPASDGNGICPVKGSLLQRSIRYPAAWFPLLPGKQRTQHHIVSREVAEPFSAGKTDIVHFARIVKRVNWLLGMDLNHRPPGLTVRCSNTELPRNWRLQQDLHLRPPALETAALPLSYGGVVGPMGVAPMSFRAIVPGMAVLRQS